jgi:dTDP-4-dehydrorhamnose reductase
MFDKATRMKLRFTTDRGILGVEDIWDLNLTQLNTLAKSLRKKLKEGEEEDFLNTKSEADVTDKLRFDIVLNILEVKKTEKAEREQASEIKMKREKLLGLIAEKQDADLRNKPVEELLKELEALGAK